jgi:hypothetical protein
LLDGKPLCIDGYCGLGGWAEGFLAEGWRVIGFDIERHDYGTGGYPGELVLQDVLTLHGGQFKDADFLVFSPPCQEYSYRAMPWKRAKALPPPDNRLFDACFRIQREASAAAGHYIPMVVENVKGAQRWVGRAACHWGSFYLWGDVPALMPFTASVKNSGGSWFAEAHNTRSGKANNPVSVPAGDGVKQGGSGAAWFDKALDERRKAAGLKTPEGNNLSDGFTWATSRMIDKTMKPAGFRLGPESRTQHLSFSRKAASAQIAKIPFPLSSWIARCFLPCNAGVSVLE